MITRIINYLKQIFPKREDQIPLRDRTYTFVKIGEWGILIERVK